DSDSIGKLLDEQMNCPLPSLLEVDPDLSPVVQAALEKMCAKKADARPGGMGEVIELLEAARPRPIEPAPIAIRASAAAVDFIFMLFAMGVPGVIIRFAGSATSLASLNWLPEFMAGLFLVAAQFGLEAWKGFTPAKYAFNLRVVRHDGLKAGTGPLLLRFLLRYPIVIAMLIPPHVPEVVMLTGLLQLAAIAAAFLCFFLFRRRTHSDLITRTRVIYVGSGKPVMPFRRKA
ncbi:MAG: RDD family protein, partial [Planctomycetota bacterium]